MALSEAKKAADKRHTAKLDNIMVRPYLAEGAAIRAAAAAAGKSVQGYVLEAVREKMGRGSALPGEDTGVVRAGSSSLVADDKGTAGMVVVSLGAVPDENICSRFISQWGPDFQSALDSSGQSAEDYIKQAVAERVKRETRPPTPDI